MEGEFRFRSEDVDAAIIAQGIQAEAEREGMTPEAYCVRHESPRYYPTLADYHRMCAEDLEFYARGAAILEQAELVQSERFMVEDHQAREVARASMMGLDSAPELASVGYNGDCRHEYQCWFALRLKAPARPAMGAASLHLVSPPASSGRVCRESWEEIWQQIGQPYELRAVA
jgi:hypothetical protein